MFTSTLQDGPMMQADSQLPNTIDQKPPEKKNAVPGDPLRSLSRNSSQSSVRISKGNSEMTQRPAMALEPLIARRVPFWKSSMDMIVAFWALLFLSPGLLFIAAFIKIVSKGPVLFKQARMGYLGKPFSFWKFRTMKVGSDTTVHRDHLTVLMKVEQPMTKLDLKKDARIIPFGQFLRQSGLDELPQLFNVLRGEMSLVGPRPCLPYEADQYLRWYRGRFDVLPGITGLWQVSGKNKTTFKEMIRLDIKYTRRVSFWLDVKILLKTIPAIISQIKDRQATEISKGMKDEELA
jgi:exopolysaccharide production protein ExoY